MKAITKSTFLFLILAFSISHLQAQKDSRQNHESFRGLFSHLDLTTDQQKEIQSIKESHRMQLDALSSDASIVDKKAIYREHKKEIMLVLTNAQHEQLERLTSKRKKASRNNSHKRYLHENKNELKERYRDKKEKLIELRMSLEEQIAEDDKKIIEELRAEWKFKKQANLHKRHQGKKFHKSNKKARVSFILMAVDNSNEDINQFDRSTLTISPNPTDGNTTISFITQTSVHVRIELRNKQGSLVRTLYDEFTKRGSHQMNTDISIEKQSGYYITMTDGNGVISQPVFIIR